MSDLGFNPALLVEKTASRRKRDARKTLETQLKLHRDIAFGYARYSSEAQNESSIERQREGVAGYCGRSGLKLIDFFADRAQTGQDTDRAELWRCIHACEAHPGCALVVEKLDRALRSHEVYDAIVPRLRRAHVRIHDISGPMTTLTLPIHAYVAAEDFQRQQARMTAGRVEAFKAGRWIGPAPFGYRLVAKRLEIDPETAPIAKTIFEMRYNGASLPEIVRYLEKDLKLAPPGRGRVWNQSTLRRMLASSIYVGIAKYDVEGQRDDRS